MSSSGIIPVSGCCFSKCKWTMLCKSSLKSISQFSPTADVCEERCDQWPVCFSILALHRCDESSNPLFISVEQTWGETPAACCDDMLSSGRSAIEAGRQRENGCIQLWRNLQYDRFMDVGRLIALFLKVGGVSPAVTGDIIADFCSFQDVTALTQPVSALQKKNEGMITWPQTKQPVVTKIICSILAYSWYVNLETGLNHGLTTIFLKPSFINKMPTRHNIFNLINLVEKKTSEGRTRHHSLDC